MPRRLFPRDLGLTARMVATAVLTPLGVVAGLGAVVLLAPTRIAAFVFIALVVGVVMAIVELGKGPGPGTHEAPPEVHATVERLCLAADLPKPEIVVNAERQPNSWIVWSGRRSYRLHVTEGLLELLDPRELEAVLAHEIAHVANRDATVMTMIGGPSNALVVGGRKLARGWWPMIMGGLVAIAVGMVSSVGARALSRYREFAADAGAVALTGSAVALAAALTKVSAGLLAIPSQDLREVAVRDSFHLLPASRENDGLLATHPALKDRIARLEKLEAHLQSARPAPRT